MNFILLCDAGPGVGLGHLTRSLVVAKALQREFSADVLMFVNGPPVEVKGSGEFKIKFVNGWDSVLVDNCSFANCSVLVLDLCPTRVSIAVDQLLRKVRDFGSRIVAIDGLFDYEKDIDLFFLPSFSVDQQIIDIFHSKLVYGWDCYLIDDDPLPLNSWRNGNDVIALTGGSDVTDLGQTWPTVLHRILPKGLNVNWVVGPFAKPPKIPVSSSLNFKIHSAPNSLGDLMNKSHFAATIFGVSFFELLFRNKPTVVFSPYGLKDNSQLQQISDQGIAIVAEGCIDASEKLRMLIEKPRLAQELVVLASRLMKRSGGSRFCQEIAKFFDGTSLRR